MAYQVKLPVFEGPLDLLLHLIRGNQIDIYDIPIARITDEYFQVLTLLHELDLEVAGEFLVMAATLADREDGQRLFFFRSTPLDIPPGGGTLEVSLLDLLAAFRDVLRRVDDQGALTLVPRLVTTAERMVAILDQVTLQGSLTFEALFPPTVDRSLAIATFF